MKQMAGDSNAAGNVLRLPGVCRMTGLGRSTIHRMEATQQFPNASSSGCEQSGGWNRRLGSGWRCAPNRGRPPGPTQKRPNDGQLADLTPSDHQ